MTDHLTFESLCDLADGALVGAPAESARAHIAGCADCSEKLKALTTLASQASELPRGITPPADLWADIRREIAPEARPRTAFTAPVAWLAAAAVVIAVASSSLTFLVMRGNGTNPGVARGTQTGTTPPELPARLASNEVRYTRDIEALQRTLAERRDSLAPSTVQTIERSLRVADSAIAEARAALAHDPSNAALAALFASNYERKIDLLKRATELTPRT